MEGILKISRFGGTEEYSFESGTITFLNGTVSLNVKAAKCVSGLADTAGLKALPIYTLIFKGSLELLSPRKVLRFGSSDADSTFYYVEHQKVEESSLEIFEVTDEAITARISGTTVDVNNYEGSKPPAKLEIVGRFVKREGRQGNSGRAHQTNINRRGKPGQWLK
ncbi:MAG: hypothetical protein V1820_03120 [archaeon]